MQNFKSLAYTVSENELLDRQTDKQRSEMNRVSSGEPNSKKHKVKRECFVFLATKKQD